MTPTNFPNGSSVFPFKVATNEPLHKGHVGLLAFQAKIHWEWKYFLHVEQSSRAYSYLFIYEKHITQSVSSFKSIYFASFVGFYNLLFNRLASC